MQPGPYAPPVAPSPPPRIGPSLWWFAVAGVVAAAGIVVAIVIFVLGITAYVDRIDGFERVAVPGTEEITIEGTGGYSVYHEYEGAGDSFDDAFVPEPTVTITGPSGDEVDLDPYGADVSYSDADRDGEGLSTFDVDEPGTYTVVTDGSQESTVAIGRGIGRGLVSTMVGAVVVGGLSVIAGVAIAIVVGVRRSQNRSRLRPPVPPPGPPGWGGYGGYGYGAYGGYAGYPAQGPAPGYAPSPGYPPSAPGSPYPPPGSNPPPSDASPSPGQGR